MPSHPHEELARALWKAVSTADLETLARLTTDDITWHASGRGPKSGDYQGREVVLDYLASLGEDSDEFVTELSDVLVGDLHTALLYRVTGRRGERRLETGYVLLLRMELDRLAEAWSVARDQYAVDAFWAE
ncbi:MAG: nuclear transport factor 2 family protein [Myxococcota bacterium]